MNKIAVISGSTSLYHSQRIKDFNQAEAYPLAWEIMFRNDEAGKGFALDLQQIFRKLPKESGRILENEQDLSEPIRCIECVFKDRDSFRMVLNQVLANRSFIDEAKGEIVPKLKLLQKAGEVMQQKIAVAI